MEAPDNTGQRTNRQSAPRLKRFFVETDHGYQIQKAIRDLCVFARHDLAKDPPFSRLDLISCRNVLIYMGTARDEARKSGDYARAIVDTIHEALLVVDSEFRVLTVNASFCRLFHVRAGDVENQYVFHVGKEQWNVPRLRELIEEILPKSAEIRDFAIDQEFPEIGLRHLVLNARRIETSKTILIAIEDLTERKQAQEAVEKSQSSIRALLESAAQSIIAVDSNQKIVLANGNVEEMFGYRPEERRRVSRELHDQICQQLASLAIDIGGYAANPPSSRDLPSRLKALQVRVVKASEEARHLAYDLHPSMLDDLGLVASLRALCSEFSERNPATAVEFNGGALPASMAREVASCVFRAAQESLQNIAKHSKAKQASVTLGFEKGAVVLTVEDDGAGFDPEAVKGRGGLGLVGLKERARLVNGKVTVATEPGHGTRITLVVPSPDNTP